MGDVKIAGQTPDDFKLGTTQVDEVYHGTELVWPPANPVSKEFGNWRFTDSSITYNSDRVNGVDDTVGFHPLAQGQYDDSPGYVVSDSGINDLDCIEVVANTSRMNCGLGTNLDDVTIALVYKGPPNAHRIIPMSNWSDRFESASTGKLEMTGYVTDNAILDNNWHYIIYDMSTTTPSIMVDGVVQTAVGTPTVTSFNGMGIWNAGANAIGARMAHLIVYDSILSPAEKSAVNSYFQTTYNL